MLAYTRAETELETCTLREFLEQKKENENNRRFLENINDRVVAINNNSSVPAEALRNRDALIQMVDVVVADNIKNDKPVMFTNELFKTAGMLHDQIASVVRENNFHPILVNATIEAITNIRSERLTFDVFLNEVESILGKRETSEENNNILDLFIERTNKVNRKCVDQVQRIYDEIRPEVNNLRGRIKTIALAVAVVTAATVVVGSVAGGPATVTGMLFSVLFAR